MSDILCTTTSRQTGADTWTASLWPGESRTQSCRSQDQHQGWGGSYCPWPHRWRTGRPTCWSAGIQHPLSPAPRGLARGTTPSWRLLGPLHNPRLSALAWGFPYFRFFKYRKQPNAPCSPPDDSMLYIHSEERTEKVLFSNSIKVIGFVKIEIARLCLFSRGSSGPLFPAARAPQRAWEPRRARHLRRPPLHSAEQMRIPAQRHTGESTSVWCLGVARKWYLVKNGTNSNF